MLKAARIIQDALDTEGQQIRSNLPMLQVMAPGEDQISVQAAQAWNDRLAGGADSYTVRVEQYLQSLQNLVDNLITSAKQYNDLDDVVAAKRGQYSLIVVLDGIEDPHNPGVDHRSFTRDSTTIQICLTHSFATCACRSRISI